VLTKACLTHLLLLSLEREMQKAAPSNAMSPASLSRLQVSTDLSLKTPSTISMSPFFETLEIKCWTSSVSRRACCPPQVQGNVHMRSVYKFGAFHSIKPPHPHSHLLTPKTCTHHGMERKSFPTREWWSITPCLCLFWGRKSYPEG